MEDNPKSGTRGTSLFATRDFFLVHHFPSILGKGVVLVDPEYVKDRKVFVHLLGAFRYGRDEVDLLGLSYHKDIYLSTKQVYPRTLHSVVDSRTSSDGVGNDLKLSEPSGLTRLQERLMRKLGVNAHPFYFQLPPYSAPSVSLNLSPSDSGKASYVIYSLLKQCLLTHDFYCPCRVDYELKVYVADEYDDKPQKRNSVRMVIRKLTYAPEEPGPQPSTEVLRDFLMSVGSLRAEVSLDKQVCFILVSINPHFDVTDFNSYRVSEPSCTEANSFAATAVFLSGGSPFPVGA
ncbi:Beta-arrestin-1 [Fasciolopsis buskii]|uniref:Beta-arrestin-1 n=1 Tax=Fasciolopsis buskii TaxID=27845 RepID=A0A8E0RN08_9TREM|nr:Beta-arrestin-1 [Fasciolopsis buski]